MGTFCIYPNYLGRQRPYNLVRTGAEAARDNINALQITAAETAKTAAETAKTGAEIHPADSEERPIRGSVRVANHEVICNRYYP